MNLRGECLDFGLGDIDLMNAEKLISVSETIPKYYKPGNVLFSSRNWQS